MSQLIKITGTNFADLLIGSGLHDKIKGKKGADSLDGGAGNDKINGGHGDDWITSSAGNDTIDGGKGIDTAVYLGLYREYLLSLSSSRDKVVVSDLIANRDGVDTLKKVEYLLFRDAIYDVDKDVVYVLNRAPAVATPIADQAVQEDHAVAFTLDANTFSDADNDALTLAATLADGSALPSWLGFNAATRTFSGTPPQDFNGALDLRVTATDGEASAFDVFRLTIMPVNDAPTATADILTSVAEDSGTRSIAFSDLTDNDSAGPNEADQVLTVTAVSGAVGGSVAILGGSVRFTPAPDFHGTAAFDYTITDNGTSHILSDPRSALGHVTFTVTPENDAPVISGNSEALVYEDGPRAASGRLLGTDIDAGSLLTWSVDDATSTFGSFSFDGSGGWSYVLRNGAPNVQALRQAQQVGDSLTLRLTDEQGASVTQVVKTTVVGTNDAPASPQGPASGFVNEHSLGASARLSAIDRDHDPALTWSVSRSPTGYSSSYRYALDNLTIDKNGNPYFNDGFDNTLPIGPAPAAPNFADGSAASYQGPGRYSAQNGNLILDGALAGASTGIGVSRLIVGQPLQLNSDINPADVTRGLKATDSFTVSASYALGADTNGPNDIWQSFGVTLTDRTIGGALPDQLGNDVLSLRVVSDAASQPKLQFAQYNAVTDTVTVLQTLSVEPELLPNPEHAVFRLVHDAATPGVIRAAVDIVSSGSVVATYTFEQAGHIFSDENWTRVQLAAFGADEGGSQIAGTYGTQSVDGTGQWSYQLNAASPAYQSLIRNAVDNFTVRVIDEYGLSTFRPVSITVAAPNHAPIAIAEAYSTAYNTPLTIPISMPLASPIAPLLANDRDPDGDPLSFQFFAAPGFSQVGPNIVFTPAPGMTGPNGFNYVISDGRGGSAAAYASVTVSSGPAPLGPVINAPTQQLAGLDMPFIFSEARGNRITVTDADSAMLTVTLFAGASDIDFGFTGDVMLGSTANGGITLAGAPAGINAALNGLKISPGSSELNSTWLGIEVSDGAGGGSQTSLSAHHTLALMRTSGPVDSSTISVQTSMPLLMGSPRLDDPLVMRTHGLNGHMGDRLDLDISLSHLVGNMRLTFSGNSAPIFNDYEGPPSFSAFLGGYYMLPTAPVQDFDLAVEITNLDLGITVRDIIPVHIGNIAPVIVSPGQQSVPAGRVLQFSAAHGNAITVDDADGDDLSVTLRSLGQLGVDATTGAQVVDRGAGVGIDIVGTAAQVNAALSTLIYTPGGISRADFIAIAASDTGFFNGFAVGTSVPVWVADPVPELRWITPNAAAPNEVQLRISALPAGEPFAIQWGDSGSQDTWVSNGSFLDLTHTYAPGLVSTFNLIPSHGALVQYRVQVASAQSSTLPGTLGDDLLLGSVIDDVLTSSGGADVLVGGPSADRFIFRALNDRSDTLVDFNAAQGDKLDIRELLTGTSGAPSSLVQFVESGGSTTIEVSDGSRFFQVATLQGVTGLAVDAMVANGNLIVA